MMYSDSVEVDCAVGLGCKKLKEAERADSSVDVLSSSDNARLENNGSEVTSLSGERLRFKTRTMLRRNVNNAAEQ